MCIHGCKTAAVKLQFPSNFDFRDAVFTDVNQLTTIDVSIITCVN